MKAQIIKIKDKNVAESIAKIANDKELVRLFLKNKISIKELNERGVNFAKPL